MTSLLLVLLLIFPFHPQSNSGSDLAEGLFESYTAGGSKRVIFKLYLSGARPNGLLLEASYTQFKIRPDLNYIDESLMLITPNDRATQCRPQETLRLVLNGKSQSFQFTCRNGVVDNFQLQLLEPLNFADILIPLSSVDSVEGKIGSTKFKLNATQIQKIREFLKARRSEFRFRPIR